MEVRSSLWGNGFRHWPVWNEYFLSQPQMLPIQQSSSISTTRPTHQVWIPNLDQLCSLIFMKIKNPFEVWFSIFKNLTVLDSKFIHHFTINRSNTELVKTPPSFILSKNWPHPCPNLYQNKEIKNPLLASHCHESSNPPKIHLKPTDVPTRIKRLWWV